MLLIQAFRQLNRHLVLVLYPLVFDLIALLIGWSLIGFYGEAQLSLRLILEMGFPSVSHILNTPLLVNTTEFFNAFERTTLLTLLIVLGMVLVGAFMQGGYIGSLYRLVADGTLRFADFLQYGKRNWLRFIFLLIIVFLAKIAVTTFLAMFFGAIGVFASFSFFYGFAHSIHLFGIYNCS